MSAIDPRLPQARLVPKDGADRMAILRGQAAERARTAGRVAMTATKAIAIVALCAGGLVAIGAASRSRSYDSDHLNRRLEKLNQSLKSLREMPKIDFSRLRKLDLDPDHQRDPSALVIELESTFGASPSQSTSTSSR